MRAIIAIVILLLVLLLAGLIVYILADRAWSVIMARYELRRRAVLAAAMDRWLASEPEQRPDEFLRPRPPFDRALAVQLCLERLPASDERSRSRMLDWLENSGQVASWLPDLSGRGTSIVRGSWGRYTDGAAFTPYMNTVSGVADFIVYAVLGDGTLFEIDRVPAFDYAIDPDTAHLGLDEATVSWEQQLRRDLRVSATGIWRDYRDFVAAVIPRATCGHTVL